MRTEKDDGETGRGVDLVMGRRAQDLQHLTERIVYTLDGLLSITVAVSDK